MRGCPGCCLAFGQARTGSIAGKPSSGRFRRSLVPAGHGDAPHRAGASLQVRDRGTLHLAELNGLAGGPAAINVQWNIPAKNLEKSLRAYLENGTDAPFDLVTCSSLCTRLLGNVECGACEPLGATAKRVAQAVLGWPETTAALADSLAIPTGTRARGRLMQHMSLVGWMAALSLQTCHTNCALLQ